MRRRTFLLSALPPAAVAWAQSQQQPPSDSQIQVQVNVVNVPVTVTDVDGKFVWDLERTDFRIWEDDKPVEVRYFTRDPKQPIIIGFVVDASNYARLYFKTYKEAVEDLAWTLVPPGEQSKGFLVAYHTQPDILVKPTGDTEAIVDKIRKLKPGGGAALLDAIYESCTKYFTVRGLPREPKRVLVVVGDGHDNASKVSLEQALEAAQRSQVVIYGVSTVAYGFTGSGESTLYRLAEETGGRVEKPLDKIHTKVSGYLSNPSDEGNYAYKVGTGQYASELAGKLYKAITDISGDVTHQYVLGYTPPTPFTDTKFRTIKVELAVKNADALKLRARKGYYPPLVERPASQP
jgi:VWFA-related protein